MSSTFFPARAALTERFIMTSAMVLRRVVERVHPLLDRLAIRDFSTILRPARTDSIFFALVG
jgi:hypothetical protein